MNNIKYIARIMAFTIVAGVLFFTLPAIMAAIVEPRGFMKFVSGLQGPAPTAVAQTTSTPPPGGANFVKEIPQGNCSRHPGQYVANAEVENEYIFVAPATPSAIFWRAEVTQILNADAKLLSASMSNAAIYRVRVIDPTKIAVVDVKLNDSSCGDISYNQAWSPTR